MMDTQDTLDNHTLLTTMLPILDNIMNKMNKVEEEFTYGQMGLNIWDIGKMEMLQATDG